MCGFLTFFFPAGDQLFINFLTDVIWQFFFKWESENVNIYECIFVRIEGRVIDNSWFILTRPYLETQILESENIISLALFLRLFFLFLNSVHISCCNGSSWTEFHPAWVASHCLCQWRWLFSCLWFLPHMQNLNSIFKTHQTALAYHHD